MTSKHMFPARIGKEYSHRVLHTTRKVAQKPCDANSKDSFDFQFAGSSTTCVCECKCLLELQPCFSYAEDLLFHVDERSTIEQYVAFSPYEVIKQSTDITIILAGGWDDVKLVNNENENGFIIVHPIIDCTKIIITLLESDKALLLNA
jgi:hypothetical protein